MIHALLPVHRILFFLRYGFRCIGVARIFRKHRYFRISSGLSDRSSYLSAPIYTGRRGHLFSDKSMRLTDRGIGETVRVIAVNAGRRVLKPARLRGIARGQISKVVSASRGPFVLAVGGGIPALGRGMAARIAVGKYSDEKNDCRP